MNNLHGIIYAYDASPRMGELVSRRTCASMPFCGRYRAIDFPLSSLINAGVRNVGVIMQRDYQSLLDHLGSGKSWDLSRLTGGLRLMPPFGLPDSHSGEYKGCMEALEAVVSYIEDITTKYVALMRGNLITNIDMEAVMAQHEKSGMEITAVCSKKAPPGLHHRFINIDDNTSTAGGVLCNVEGTGAGYASLEVYILSKELLLSIISHCSSVNELHFHRNALTKYFSEGNRIGIYVHDGFYAPIRSVGDYYKANMDMLDPVKRSELFLESRPIRTKDRAEVSTYYGDGANVVNSLLADGCYIEGTVKNCILFRGVRIEKGAVLENCIIMQGSVIGKKVVLKNVIADKEVSISPHYTLTGSERLPLVIPKGSRI
jgi:glucose-1-phosphate adenylyltransferase